MENQHQKITGYRELSQAEIDLINQIKAKAQELEKLTQDVHAFVHAQWTAASLADDKTEQERMDAASPVRWVAIARTDFQTGLMALTRAVAQPTTF